MLKTLVMLLVFPLVFTSCVQSENSSSQDSTLYPVLVDAPPGQSPGFSAARTILQQNCANCHSYHSMTEQQMVTAGVLTLGSPSSSAIYYRLVGSTSGPGPKSMPSGGALSAGDVSTIESWIQNAN